MHNTITLRLTRAVSERLLPDLRALLPAEALQFFANGLDEQWHYTLLCARNETNSALIVSAILVWLRLGKIHRLQYSNQTTTLDLSEAAQNELFAWLTQPQAVLHIS